MYIEWWNFSIPLLGQFRIKDAGFWDIWPRYWGGFSSNTILYYIFLHICSSSTVAFPIIITGSVLFYGYDDLLSSKISSSIFLIQTIRNRKFVFGSFYGLVCCYPVPPSIHLLTQMIHGNWYLRKTYSSGTEFSWAKITNQILFVFLKSI